MSVVAERIKKCFPESRAVKWLLNGALLILFFPMVIPASDAQGCLVIDRLYRLFPVFFVVFVARLFLPRSAKIDGSFRRDKESSLYSGAEVAACREDCRRCEADYKKSPCRETCALACAGQSGNPAPSQDETVDCSDLK